MFSSRLNDWYKLLPLICALGALTIGILVYLFDRQAGDIYFIPDWIYLAKTNSPVFGQLGNYLPTFIHVYAFILLTYVVAPSIRLVIPICVSWFIIDSLFELAQIASIAQTISVSIPAWFSGVPFLENVEGYFLHGTFDYLDIISIALGTLGAYLTIRLSYREREQYVSQE